MANNNFTKVIGSTERAIKALLDRALDATSTPFEWWTTLVLLNNGASRFANISNAAQGRANQLLGGAVAQR